MRNREYWTKRFEQLEEAQLNKGAAYFSELENHYTRAAREVQKEINQWYARFAVNNEITLQEARKILRADELKEFKWSVKDYIKHGEENNISGQWAKQLENASARWHITRLDALKLQMQNHVEMLFGYEQDSVTRLMEKIYSDGYYHTAYELQKGFNIGYDLMKLDTRQIEKVISKPWAADGSNFSSRIWKQKTQLVSELHTELTQAIIRGQNPGKITDYISNRFGVSKRNAGRLVMTEAAFFASASTKDCFNDLGVERYEICATLDSHTSDTCQGLDGRVFKMSEYEVGVTAPPFHQWCRTTTVPYFDDEFELGTKRAARGGDGKIFYVPAAMKYPEWKKAFVDGGSKKGLTPIEKMLEKVEEISERVRVSEQKNDEDTSQEKAKITFAPAKTIEEAQETAKQFIGNGYSKTFKNEADFKGISLDNANEVNRTIAELYAQYDMPKINGIKAISPTSAQGKKVFLDSDAVAAYSPIEHGIFLNKDVLKSAKALESYNKQADEAWDIVMQNIDKLSDSQKEIALTYKNAGRSLVGDGSVQDYITHEMGHHVQWEVLDSATNNAMGKNMSKYAPNISGYANASKGEYIAESFVAYTKGEIDILDPVFVDYMKASEKAQKVTETLENATKSSIMKVKNSELPNGLPIEGEPNSIVDKVDDAENTLQRRKYGPDGKAAVDYDTTDHNMPQKHPTGAHKHEFDYSKKRPRTAPKPLTEKELKENSDIIKKGVNYRDEE